MFIQNENFILFYFYFFYIYYFYVCKLNGGYLFMYFHGFEIPN